ncbi:CHAT domain-containing protein [Dictyobacter kobayashii]|uniref:CHAT domain-containing protein n=1 Tax=Dictyobacter kobayashii TaxID=2014872 RepID=UPI001386E267|nr:CHAT domain-containing protein [Dictyobacter kobayashii]
MDNNEIVKILFLAASPHGTKSLQLDNENRSIKEYIQRSTYRDNFRVESEWAVRDSDLLYFMNSHHPQIVHFSGHGTQSGEFVLEGQDRSIKPVSDAAFHSLMKFFKNEVKLVILNACNSATQAEVIAQEIDFVIGMDAPINDKAAISFISAFYQALGFGNSIQNSFEQGLIELQIKNIPAEHIPQLFVRTGLNANQAYWRDLVAQPAPLSDEKSQETGSLKSKKADEPVSIVISYAPEDEKFRKNLEKHFITMKRNGDITIWHTNSTTAGDNIIEKVHYLDTADIVLLLVSKDFLFSDSIYENELRPAINRRSKGLTHVIPIIVSETADWEKDRLFGGLYPLPREKRPVSAWKDEDSAIVSIVNDVRTVINGIKAQRSS